MKIFLVLLSSVLLLAGSACSKQEPTPPPVNEPPAPSGSAGADLQNASERVQSEAAAARQTMERAADEVQAQAGDVQETVEKTAAGAQAQTAALTSGIQASLENARKLLAENNWSEALKVLGELASVKLTPEQQSTLENLKQQAQKLAQDAVKSKPAEQASKAIGDLLQKK